jgi:hypothetical protein
MFGTNWTLVDDPIYGNAAYDEYGNSVSLSNSGFVLAVGAISANRDTSG